MEQPDRDVEVFERIPWESLRPASDRRWWVYVAAAAIVMGALGVSLGRSWAASGPVDVEATTGSLPPPTSTVPASPLPPPAPVPTSAAPTTSTVWSEADLMAVPGERLEAAAETLATWFVVDRFSRDGSGAAGRSFVEWAGPLETGWTSSSSARVKVAVRRLVAMGDDPYRRIPDETWAVDVELRDDGWVVTHGPIAAGPAELRADVDTGDAVTWTDPAGLEWEIAEEAGSS